MDANVGRAVSASRNTVMKKPALAVNRVSAPTKVIAAATYMAPLTRSPRGLIAPNSVRTDAMVLAKLDRPFSDFIDL